MIEPMSDSRELKVGAKSIPFALVHLAALAGALIVPFSWGLVALCLAVYAVRMFGITGGYHRYFSHRSFKTGRGFQFVLACLGATAMQKGPLWWAAHHRRCGGQRTTGTTTGTATVTGTCTRPGCRDSSGRTSAGC
jgi:fatty-acid desaturase